MKKYTHLFTIIASLIFGGVFAQTIKTSTDKNAVIHSKLRVATTNETDANDPNKAVITVAYSDGLGRGLQTVGYQQSPTNKDIVSGAVEFDKFGRVIRTAMPAPTTDNTGTYQANAFSLANGFYGDSYAYSATTSFDNSPLNRAREQYGAGNAWRTANKKIQNYDESAGTDVRYYYIDGGGNIILSGTYPSNSLYKKRIIDEQGHTSISISDKRGRLIQKQLQDNIGYATTYYLYDGLGRILAVIQPEGYELNQSISKNSTEWQRWVFSYEYDYRGRMHLKHVPSSGDEYMVYDKWDRLVWSQSSMQREFGKWSFYKYDAFNREIMRGEKSESRGLNALETEAWAWSGDRYESRVGGGVYYSYSNTYPQIFSESDIRHINYYDNYNNWPPSSMAFANGGTAFHAQHPEAQGLMVGARSRSSIDNSWLASVLYYDNKMRVIRTFSQNVYGQIEMLDTEYNHAGEILQTKKVYKESNGTTRTKQKIYSFDHAGRKTAYNLTIGNLNDRIANYEYDEIGRQKQKIYFPNNTFQYGGAKDYIIRPTQDGLVIQPNTEDIARKAIILEPTPSIGINSIYLNSYKAEINPNAPQGITIAGLQKINYKWHLRGWLLGINLDASNTPTPTASEADLFSYKLDFETAGFYDGNIGKQTWKGVDNNARSYTFAYNTAKQLSNATYSGINGENFNLQGISYNKNGSIKTLQRFGQTGTNAYGLLDNLSYNYNGNRLTQITDSQNSNNTWEFVQRGNSSYNFYTDGSLKSDANEQIQNIIYDTFLKQAVELQLTDGRKQKNYYAGNGNLLKIIYLDASNTVIETWEFSDDIVYKNGTFYQINDDEGRIILENGQYSYEFDYKDHLGNTRVSFKASGNQLIKTAESAFEPWGNRIPIGISNAFQNRWEFQGKTKEATFGLNRVDFGARTMN